MILRWLFALFLVCALAAPAPAQSVIGSGISGDAKASGGGGACLQYTAFATRATVAGASLNGTYAPLYQTLICNGVTNGWYGSCQAVYIFASQAAVIALLDITANASNATANGSPTFTAGIGYSGLTTSTVNITTPVNTSSGGLLTQNSAMVGIWQGSGGTTSNFSEITDTDNVQLLTFDFPGIGANIYDTSGLADASAAGNGFSVANRSGSAARQLYRNGVSTASDTHTSAASTGALVVHAGATGVRTAVVAICGSLASGVQTSFYNDLNTFLTATGGT